MAADSGLVMLLAGLGAGVLLAVLVVVLVLLRRSQLSLAAQLRALDEQHQQRLQALRVEASSFQQGSICMGDELIALRDKLKQLEDRLQRVDQTDPHALPYNQAARLVSMGASIEDVTQSCGLSKAEAELVAKLHSARKQP